MTSTRANRMAGGSEIYRPSTAQAKVLGRTIAKAFHQLPASHYLIPDPRIREAVFPDAFRIDVLDTMDSGTPYAAGNGGAVALWQPLGTKAPDRLAEPDPRITALDEDLGKRYLQFHQILHDHHPHGREHHWLMILAVRPDLQHQGLGSKLLTAHHEYLDSQGLPAYLEAASLRSRELYRRHGYTDAGDPIELPNKSLMYPMMREPGEIPDSQEG